MKYLVIVLALVIILSPVLATPARAASDDGGASNLTLGLLAVVGVVFLISAWRMDSDNDDPITQGQPNDEDIQLVICQPSGNASAGLGLRAAF